MADSCNAKTLQFVVKVSKYCNLRCSYCYEYPELSNKARMQLDDLRNFFSTVSDYCDAKQIKQVCFIWHGGEPFLIPVDYYLQIQEIQEKTFSTSVDVVNAIQTNLTVLTERHMELLQKSNMFNGLGISFDVYGDQRVDVHGRLRTDTVLQNMQRLINNRIRFGAITVLARNTLPHAVDIYTFYDRLGVESRLLPFYMSATDQQISRHALSGAEITAAFKKVFDAWAQSDTATPVEPINDYIDYAIAHLINAPWNIYAKRDDNSVYMVDLDGGLWDVTEAYDADKRYGNVFSEKFAALLDSPRRNHTLQAAQARREKFCESCPYFGRCTGQFVTDATPEQQAMLDREGCPVREMVTYIASKLAVAGVADEIAQLKSRGEENPALAVNV